jgi:hypothetical protein
MTSIINLKQVQKILSTGFQISINGKRQAFYSMIPYLKFDAALQLCWINEVSISASHQFRVGDHLRNIRLTRKRLIFVFRVNHTNWRIRFPIAHYDINLEYVFIHIRRGNPILRLDRISLVHVPFEPFRHEHLEQSGHIDQKGEHAAIAMLVGRSGLLQEEPTKRVERLIIEIQPIVQNCIARRCCAGFLSNCIPSVLETLYAESALSVRCKAH